MQVAISCRHGSISSSAQQQITAKAERLLTYFERVTEIRVTFEFNNGRVKSEILVDAEHKHNFISHHEAASVVASFDQAHHKMEQQIRKYKERIQDHRRDRPLNELTKEASQ